MRAQNSAVEWAEAAGPPPWPSADARRTPQLPLQCSRCQRWVDRSRCAVMPEGASPWCSICAALDEVRGAVRTTSVTLATEEEILEALFHIHSLLRGQGS